MVVVQTCVGRTGTSTIGRPPFWLFIGTNPTLRWSACFSDCSSIAVLFPQRSVPPRAHGLFNLQAPQHIPQAVPNNPTSQLNKRRPPSYIPRNPNLRSQARNAFHMAREMHGHSWRSRVAAHLAPVKEYLPHHHHLHLHHHHHHNNPTTETGCVDGDAKKHSWSHFTNRIFARRSYGDSDPATSTERIVLLPGWASRRYRAGLELSNRKGAPYDIEIFVSGYVVKHKAHNTLSRSQRNILGLAKRIASLPKLPDLHHDDAEDHLPHETEHSAESAEDLLLKTTLLDESAEEFEAHVLHQSLKDQAKDLNSRPRPAAPLLDGVPLSISASVPTPRGPPAACHSKTGHDHHLHLRRWHSNLETRLHPFWAGVLSNRTVRVSIRPHFDLTDAELESMGPGELELLAQPLGADTIVTDADGAFKIQFVIRWESLCNHPKGAPMTSIDPNREHDFSVTAELMPPPPTPGSSPTLGEPQSVNPPSPTSFIPTAITNERVPLTYCPVRVISDIDDTVKLSGIQCGLRAVFHNVFVKDLEESLIPGMGEWYTEMWRRGVRFHYVSNGPFALLPVINDFFQLAHLPSGSVRLRSYGTRSILSDLLGVSQPSDRKRDAVLEVVTSFPHSRFILVGDSGEQDLELYAAVARDHPEQILCIFIRDVNTYEDGGGGIEDPTGTHARDGGKKRSPWGMSMSRGGRTSPKFTSSPSPPSSPEVSQGPSSSTEGYVSKTPTSPTPSGQRPYTDTLYSEPESYGQSHTTITPTMMPTLTHRLTLSEPDRKRMQLQTRLWKACAEVPMNVVFRVFRDPLECVEAFQVIDPHLPREEE